MHTNLMRRSRITGKRHRLSIVKSRVAKASHRKFKHIKRPKAVKLKISKAVKKVIRTKRTTHGLRVRRRH